MARLKQTARVSQTAPKFYRKGGAEVVITGATYMGKEQITIADEEGHTESEKKEKKRFVRKGHFRLMDLPAELRIHIYSFLLPHNVVISHERTSDLSKSLTGKKWWRIEASSKKTGDVEPMRIGRQYWVHKHHKIHDDWPKLQTQLFLVNKEVFSEARGKL